MSTRSTIALAELKCGDGTLTFHLFHDVGSRLPEIEVDLCGRPIFHVQLPRDIIAALYTDDAVRQGRHWLPHYSTDPNPLKGV